MSSISENNIWEQEAKIGFKESFSQLESLARIANVLPKDGDPFFDQMIIFHILHEAKIQYTLLPNLILEPVKEKNKLTSFSFNILTNTHYRVVYNGETLFTLKAAKDTRISEDWYKTEQDDLNAEWRTLLTLEPVELNQRAKSSDKYRYYFVYNIEGLKISTKWMEEFFDEDKEVISEEYPSIFILTTFIMKTLAYPAIRRSLNIIQPHNHEYFRSIDIIRQADDMKSDVDRKYYELYKTLKSIQLHNNINQNTEIHPF